MEPLRKIQKPMKEPYSNDIISEILVRLPTTLVLKFRCACKSWYSLTSEKSFIQSHTRRSRHSSDVILQPDITVSLAGRLNLHLLFTDDDGELIIRQLPTTIADDAAREFLPTFVSSCDGLICLDPFNDQSDSPYYICNPITNAWASVSRPANQEFGSICAFYFHDSMGEYRLMRHSKGIKFEVAGINGRSNSEWRQIENIFCGLTLISFIIQLQQTLGLRPCTPGVASNGSLHWPPYDSKSPSIIAFDIEREKFRQMSIPQQTQPFEDYYLMKMKESLVLGMTDSNYDLELWMLKDYSKELWVKQHKISIQEITGSHVKRQYCVLAIWNDDELLLKLNGNRFVLYNLKCKNYKEVETDEWKNKLIINLPFAASLVSYDSFLKDETEDLA